MNIYRATYRTQAGERRMTFTHSSLPEARRYAETWQCGDKLQNVETVRECERPVFNLTSGVAV